MAFDFDEFIAKFTWFHWGLFIVCGLVMLVSSVRRAVEWWGDREWRKKQGLSDSDVRELVEEQQARRVWRERRRTHYE
ncbi:hypothetical protein OG884_03580 [Streptosporangium sp. NBC_01755]|uniref:hypothetical protein n=1 Tax=unclassified Streptosporangium TaxID=2632669 RepID=UPI002DD8BEEC|nr:MULTISPECIES: hypothetical protein [unclassified Streptosporangium]WSA27498.1 hypothetical protein OIE13_06375 [Streptosporangium sp. NBC_01810]WSD01031.1 hypothetical protein OG884_03580 [Streptosporangium sp. NBC_01755]